MEDGAEALIKSLELKENHYFFNIGVNKGISIFEMAKIIAKSIDWNGEFTFDTSKPDGAEEKRVLGKFTEKNQQFSPAK